MTLLESIQQYAGSIPAELKESRGLYDLSFTVAERKVFLSRQRLEYRAKFKIDDINRVLKFTELLKESGSGLSSGNTPGFGFKTETYEIKGKQREGGIEEQSKLFSQKYRYQIEYQTIRSKMSALAEKAGYRFQYQLTALGL